MTMYASLPERSDARRVVIDVESACSVLGGDTQRTAMVVASPHSGDRYPIDLLAASKLDAAALRRSEDAHVDVLFGGPSISARRSCMRISRALMSTSTGKPTNSTP